MPNKPTNPKTIARYDIFTEDEDNNEVYDEVQGEEVRYDSGLEEEIPEAFIPSFTVAPEEIPPEVQIPGEEEQQKAIDSLYKKLGINVKKFIEQPVQEMTPEKDKFVRDSSHMIAILVSAVSMWGYSIVGGIEYGVLAPTEDQSDNIVRPIMNIIARHSKVVSHISPDYIDIGNSLKALSDYASYSMETLAMIREDKRNGRQTTSREARPGVTATRSNDVQGQDTAARYEYAQDNGATSSEYSRKLTDDERRNYESLQQLSKRDYEYRARRSGRL